MATPDRSLFACLVLMLLWSCGSGSSPDKQMEGAMEEELGPLDTAPLMEPERHDTDVVSTYIRVGNSHHPLTFSSISLNNGAVINTDSSGRKRVFHDRVWKIRFEFGGRVLDTLLTKESFSGVLPDSILQRSVFLYCEDCGVRSNTLYFQALIGAPLMQDSRFVRFNMFFRGPERGTIYGMMVDPNGRYCRAGLQ
jgi:hypothetical protein